MDLKAKPFYLSDEDVAWVENTLAGMTDEQKLHQLFCLIAYSADEGYLKYLSQGLQIGGIMCRMMPLNEVIDTVNILQTTSRIPMLIAANAESGVNGICTDAVKIGSQMQIAAAGSDMAEKLGAACGEAGSKLGLNWSFAPIVDIDYNFRNPITNTRTFGSDPDTVIACGRGYIENIQKFGVAGCAKHFPGDGMDERDQHLVPSINSLSCEEWDKTYGRVYRAMIDCGVKTVMVGHILQPAYTRHFRPGIADKDIMPASVSPELVTDLLRGQLGFNGLVITDSTTMAGLNMMGRREELVPMTIAAGCDMFLFTKNLEEDFAFMKAGYEKGIITESRLNEAVTRILALKASLGLHRRKLTINEKEAAAAVSDPRHAEYAKEVADRCITLVKEEKGVLPISSAKNRRILLYSIESSAGNMGFSVSVGAAEKFKKRLEARGYEVEVFQPKAGFEGMMEPYGAMAEKYDLLLYIANMATKSNQTIIRIEWAEPMGANVPIHIKSVPTVFISVENPYHLIDVPRVRTYINTYGSQDAVLDALLDKLEGKSAFKGVSPSDPFCGKWDTRL